MHILLHILEHTLLDTAKLIPFLFLTYLAMEFLEHKTGTKAQHMVKKAGRLGPVLGSLLGALPQCGFSAAASNLYAGRVITVGTLLAIYLSTSDEMLPILISEQAPTSLILSVLLLKIVIGVVVGFTVDLIWHPKEEEHEHIHDLCEHEHCQCEKGVFRSALSHTAQITVFILLITLVLNLVLEVAGEDALAGLLLNRPIVGPLLAGVVGLIPNCASSVVITQLYLQNVISFGSLMTGLLVGPGLGILILFRVNRDLKENLKILGSLYLVGVVAGIVIELVV